MVDGSEEFFAKGETFLFLRDPRTVNATTTSYPIVNLGVISGVKPTFSPKSIQIKDSRRGILRPRAVKTTEFNEAYDITCQNFAPQQIDLMLYGSGVQAFTQAASAVVGTTAQPGFLGQLIKIMDNTGVPIYNIGSIQAVKKGVTTLTAGTDYELADADLGLVRLLSTGVVVTDGDLITVDYTPVAVSGKRLIQPHSGGTIKGKGFLILSEDNNVDMHSREFYCELDTTGINFKNLSDYDDWSFKATVLDDFASATQPAGRMLKFKGSIPPLS